MQTEIIVIYYPHYCYDCGYHWWHRMWCLCCVRCGRTNLDIVKVGKKYEQEKEKRKC